MRKIWAAQRVNRAERPVFQVPTNLASDCYSPVKRFPPKSFIVRESASKHSQLDSHWEQTLMFTVSNNRPCVEQTWGVPGAQTVGRSNPRTLPQGRRGPKYRRFRPSPFRTESCSSGAYRATQENCRHETSQVRGRLSPREAVRHSSPEVKSQPQWFNL